jgi:hypothetical protein
LTLQSSGGGHVQDWQQARTNGPKTRNNSFGHGKQGWNNSVEENCRTGLFILFVRGLKRYFQESLREAARTRAGFQSRLSREIAAPLPGFEKPVAIQALQAFDGRGKAFATTGSARNKSTLLMT